MNPNMEERNEKYCSSEKGEKQGKIDKSNHYEEGEGGCEQVNQKEIKTETEANNTIVEGESNLEFQEESPNTRRENTQTKLHEEKADARFGMEEYPDFVSTQKSLENPPLSLIHLAWEDILFSHVLPYLSWKELFHLSAISYETNQMIIKYFNQLKHINLSNLNSFNLSAFQKVTGDCRNVRSLDVSESRWIRDEELIEFFSKNKLLTRVNLTGCTSLTGSCLLTLATKCKLVKSIILRECNWITRGALETLMTHLNSLEEIDLSSCSALSNQLIVIFVQRFPTLKKIHLAHIQSVNDATLIQISKNCRGLTLLDIRACMGVTDNGIRSIGEYCPKLTSIFVANCHLVTEYSLQILRARPDMQIDRSQSSDGLQQHPRSLNQHFLMVQV